MGSKSDTVSFRGGPWELTVLWRTTLGTNCVTFGYQVGSKSDTVSSQGGFWELTLSFWGAPWDPKVTSASASASAVAWLLKRYYAVPLISCVCCHSCIMYRRYGNINQTSPKLHCGHRYSLIVLHYLKWHGYLKLYHGFIICKWWVVDLCDNVIYQLHHVHDMF